MTIHKNKVYAYITDGDRLLVFRHPFEPEAGIQVPGGTVEPGEHADMAVMREAWEETGLEHLMMARFLGSTEFHRAPFGNDEINHRRFYHLRCASTPPETWRHAEQFPSEGDGSPIIFEFFWAHLPDEVPELIAEMGALLGELSNGLG